MPRPKPPCPKCGDSHSVSTLGGGSLGLYRYICKDVMCKAEWQQVPLHKLACGERPNPIMKKHRKKRSDANATHSRAITVTKDSLSVLATTATAESENREFLCGAVGEVLIGIDDLGAVAQSCGVA